MIKYGQSITQQQQNIPKRVFCIIGLLDSIAGIMQVFSATYLGGSLLILLSQSAIPISMIISKALLRATYKIHEYLGAAIVSTGILIVLLPSMHTILQFYTTTSNDTLLWSMVMISSSIPMCLSSVYKEKALNETQLDPIYLNGWIGIFQFLYAIPLAIPAAYAGSPVVELSSLPKNLLDGFYCYLGYNSITTGSHLDECDTATFYVTIYLLFNVTYNILILLILRYGSANILYLVRSYSTI